MPFRPDTHGPYPSMRHGRLTRRGVLHPNALAGTRMDPSGCNRGLTAAGLPYNETLERQVRQWTKPEGFTAMEAIRQLLARQGLPWLAATVVGLAMCLMVNGVFDGALMRQVDAVSFPLRIAESPLSGGVGVIAACAVLAVAATRAKTAWRVTAPGAVALAVCTVIPLALLYLSTAGLVPAAVGEVGGLALSASATALLALWAQALAPLGWKQSLFVLCMALLLDTVVDVTSSLALVDGAAAVVAFVAAAASPFLLALARGRAEGAVRADAAGDATFSGAADDGESGATGNGAPGEAVAGPLDGRGAGDEPRGAGLPLWLSIACIALYGFLMGRVQSLGGGGGPVASAGFLSGYAISIAAVVASLFMYLLAHLRRPHAVTRVAVLVTLVAALYLSGVFGSAIEPGATIAMTVARFACFAYIWLLSCDGRVGREAGEAGTEGRRALLPVLAFSAGWGAFTLVNTLSTKIGLAIGAGQGTGFALYNVAMVACFAVLILVELLPHRLAVASQPGSGSSGPSAEDALAARCQKLAREHGLTARELDVLVPLVRGRSAASIASALGMSTETARTHIRHIYQKTGIHSREELMDAIER